MTREWSRYSRFKCSLTPWLSVEPGLIAYFVYQPPLRRTENGLLRCLAISWHGLRSLPAGFLPRQGLGLTHCELALRESARANCLPSPTNAAVGAPLIGWPHSSQRLSLGFSLDTSNEEQGRFKKADIAKPLPLLIGPEACFFDFN